MNGGNDFSENGSHNALTRRAFLRVVSASAAATFLTHPALAAFELPSDELERWKSSLFKPASPRRYFSEKHADARMHLGGIGTGNFEIGVDGQFTTWQLFNTLRDGEVPFYFAIKAGNTTRLLQTAGAPDWPRIQQIEMTAEYPIAALRFHDDHLPVALELEAFTPFEPLDSSFSSKPLAVFKFRISNPTSEPQTISLAAMLANPVGYAAIGEIKNGTHPSLGSNINESFHEGRATGLFLSARSGNEPVLDKPVCIYLLKDLFVIPPDPKAGNKNHAHIDPGELNIPPLDRPKNLKVTVIGGKPFSATNLSPSAQSIIWLEDAPVDLDSVFLAGIKEAVEAGATLVFSGNQMPLLNGYASATGGKPSAETTLRPDIVFEDFERGYEKWSPEGTAFGSEPQPGPLGNQQPVSGFLGKGLVNSFVGGDDAIGKLTSQSFVIQRNFVHFLIGGGSSANTQARLIIDGKIVRAASGANSERLKRAVWDVADFDGQKAHIEIVDEQKGTWGWGHIDIDQIVFTDWPGDISSLKLVEELLPLRFSGVEKTPGKTGEVAQVVLRDPVLLPDSERSQATNGLAQFTRTIGKGKVVLLAGQLLNPTHTHSAFARQNVYAMLCSLAGANYTVTAGQSAKEPGFGTLALAALSGQVTGLSGFDDWDDAWKQFREDGRFEKFELLKASKPTERGRTTNCALASTVSVPAGGTVEIPFLFAWHYPNKYSSAGNWMGCYYAAQYRDARAVVRDAAAKYGELEKRTDSFRRTFYDSHLPYWLLDCITANSAITRHIGVVFRIANGDIYGWEGSNGSCEPTCTHVWGYEQSLARLFPDLEKDMRRIDYFHQQNADGGINNRTNVPSPPHPTGERPFTDGHASCILKAYREALNSTDESFFKEYWPHVQRAIEYLIARDAKTANGQPLGILQDDQWNTYDEALHGVTTFISGYYLAALRACEEWARRMGDEASAGRYRQIFESGQKKLIELCWNGEYFQQHLPDYARRRGEVGPGCMSDQLIGQWWAHQLGLGYIFPKEKVVSALRSIFKYNWKSDLTEWKQMPRVYAGAHDKGLVICTWPKGGRPENVMLYSDEIWTGIEYQVAAHLIYEGMIDEGFSIVRGARDRYDGVPRPPLGRNPWCEIECGGHYSRAMSSWSLLLALSGFEYDGPRASLRLNPRYQPENFKCFFSGPQGWGSFAQTVEGQIQKVSIMVKAGSMNVHTLNLKLAADTKPSKVLSYSAGKEHLLRFQVEDDFIEVHFEKKLTLTEETPLEIIVS
jgi:uncharacterized protein (DUF608 family)